jgi:hypothetical protein
LINFHPACLFHPARLLIFRKKFTLLVYSILLFYSILESRNVCHRLQTYFFIGDINEGNAKELLIQLENDIHLDYNPIQLNTIEIELENDMRAIEMTPAEIDLENDLR